MSNKPKRQYSLGERVTLAGLFLALAGIFAWLAFGLLQSSWQGHLLDQRFEREGVQTQGFVSGFRHVKFTGKYGNRDSGQYPVVTIDTPKGMFQIPTSYEHPLNKAQQDKLLWQKVDVVYLRDEPGIGRVMAWHGSSTWLLTGLGVVLLLTALFIVYKSYQLLILKF
jgi:hypothetical protein